MARTNRKREKNIFEDGNFKNKFKKISRSEKKNILRHLDYKNIDLEDEDIEYLYEDVSI